MSTKVCYNEWNRKEVKLVPDKWNCVAARLDAIERELGILMSEDKI